MLDQEIGSIIRCFNDVNKVKVYIDMVPQNFIIPSMFFPKPLTESEIDSFSTYTNDYQMFVKVFEESSLKAYEAAESILEHIRRLRDIIPIYNADGTQSNDFLRIEKLNSREIESGVRQIEIRWKSRRRFVTESVDKINKVNVRLKLGGEANG